MNPREIQTLGKRRTQLSMVEAPEERGRLLRAIRVALGVAAFGLLAGVALTGAILILFWELSRVAALLALASLYGVMAVCLYRQLTLLLRDWQNLPATLEQLRKDRAGFETAPKEAHSNGAETVMKSPMG